MEQNASSLFLKLKSLQYMYKTKNIVNSVPSVTSETCFLIKIVLCYVETIPLVALANSNQ